MIIARPLTEVINSLLVKNNVFQQNAAMDNISINQAHAKIVRLVVQLVNRTLNALVVQLHIIKMEIVAVHVPHIAKPALRITIARNAKVNIIGNNHQLLV